MPAGHTDKATINQRRPLNGNMKAMLVEIHFAQVRYEAFDERRKKWTLCTTPEKNTRRALYDRGLIEGDPPKLTDAGRMAFEEHMDQ